MPACKYLRHSKQQGTQARAAGNEGGADSQTKLPDMEGAILDAIEQGDHGKVAGLLKDAKNTDLGHCLRIACHFGQPQCVQLLLAARAAIDQPESNGVTPLYATAPLIYCPLHPLCAPWRAPLAISVGDRTAALLACRIPSDRSDRLRPPRCGTTLAFTVMHADQDRTKYM